MRTYRGSAKLREAARKEVSTAKPPKLAPTYSSVSETTATPYIPEPKPRLRREIVKR